MAWSEVFKIKTPRFPYQFHLHGLSDLQIGSQDSSPKIIRHRVEEICDDPVDSATVILGDIEDEDRPTTRELRKAVFAGRPEVIFRDAQKHMRWIDQDVIPRLLPLQRTKYGILGLVAGHHWTQLSPVLNSAQYIAQELSRLSKRRVHYLGEMSSWIDIYFCTPNGKSARSLGHIQHGEGGGQTKGSTLQRLERTMQGFEADWYMRAHDCQQIAFKTDRLSPKECVLGKTPDIVSETKVCINLGSATQGYNPNRGAPSYIESGMMRPTTMGWGSLHFNLRCAKSWEDPSRNIQVDIKVEI